MEYKNVNDYEVLYMIRESNEAANEYMYSKYKPLINKLATNISKKYRGIGIEYDDLFQEGMYGLSEAINNFNVRENNLFFTFAILCIKREMERLLIKSIRHKNNVLNFAISFDTVISEEGLTVGDIIYDGKDLVDNKTIEREQKKFILDLKYELKDIYSPVYELKLNGFSNNDIAILLDLKYKDVDNYLRSIKKTLKKVINKCIDIDFSML